MTGDRQCNVKTGDRGCSHQRNKTRAKQNRRMRNLNDLHEKSMKFDKMSLTNIMKRSKSNLTGQVAEGQQKF